MTRPAPSPLDLVATTSPSVAHDFVPVGHGIDPLRPRTWREAADDAADAPFATRAEGAGNRAVPEEPDPLPHLLRARPRPHPAQPPPSGASPARPRCSSLPRRPPAHPAHPRPRGRPGRRRHRPSACGLNVALTEAIATRARLRPRPGRPRQRGRALAVPSRAATTTRCGAPTWCSRRSTCAPRRSTGCATTPGTGPPRPRPRARSCPGPTASPTSATTSRTPSPPGIVDRRRCSRRGARALSAPTAAHAARRVHHRDGRRPSPTTGGVGHAPADGRRRSPRSGRFNYERIYLRPDVGRPGRRVDPAAPGAGRALVRRPPRRARPADDGRRRRRLAPRPCAPPSPTSAA